jgi:hypothetical protein
MYMLYNDEHGEREGKTPSDSNVFGMSMLLTLGVEIAGKMTKGRFKPFTNLDELIRLKASMRKAPKGNVPIEITKEGDTIYVSGLLSKPTNKGNIGHDPSIGALSLISACIRKLGWEGKIVITKHGVSQEYANKNRTNKFWHIANALGLTLDGITINKKADLPSQYWHYEKKSEKVASILLHVTAEYYGLKEVYQNHAGCERGYFKTEDSRLLALPKKDSGGKDNLLLPDVILYDCENKCILLVEGKKLTTLKKGLEEIRKYESIIREYINKYYPDADIECWLSIFGGNKTDVPHDEVLIYLNDDGKVYINENAPNCIKKAFDKVSK